MHLAIRPGTNLAVLNGLAQQLLEHGRVDRAFLERHTIGLDGLEKVVAGYTPERVAEICGVPAHDVRRAAEILGEAEHLLTFVLQGVYQSHQATASACAANNLNLLRGMIGRPGCGILQMNGQPTAQNTRETGCNGDLPGFRNWQNEAHVAELAELWNVESRQIPHWGPPTHAMEIFRYAEQGSIELLWVSGTNPAVSLPDLGRIRSILTQDSLFLVVSDAFLTETARLADVVLPAALWGEKTGTFTNTDRTVHLAEQAVDPQARLDPIWRSSWTTPDGSTCATGTVSRSSSGRRPRRASTRGRNAVAGGPATTPVSATRSSAAGAASSGPATTRPRTAPSGFTRTTSSRRPRTRARTTAMTCGPVRRSRRRSSRRSARAAGRS